MNQSINRSRPELRIRPSKARLRTSSQHYAEHNGDAARLILTDVDKFGGEDALAVRWARLSVSAEQAQRTLVPA